MKKKLQPVPLNGNERPEAVAADKPAENSASVDVRTPTEIWMEENPEFKEENRSAEPDPTGDAVTANSEDQNATPANDNNESVAPAARNAVQASEPDKDPKAATPASVETPSVAPVAQTPKTYAAEEKFALSDGNEWTRSQIVEGLQRAQSLQPLVSEAEGFRKLFNSDLATATKNWSPLLERLSKEPQTVAFVDGYLSNPEKAAYLSQCAAYFDKESPTGQAAPVANAANGIPHSTLPPEAQRELQSLREFRERMEREEAVGRVNREMEQATQRYPFLATDINLRNDLVMTAKSLNSQDPSKGILDALALKTSIYDALAIARTQRVGTTPEAPTVPALVTGAGATPNVHSQEPVRPKKFPDTVDAVEDWLHNPPAQYKS